MTTDYKSNDAAGIRRNVESIHERRGRLREIEAAIENGSFATAGAKVALPTGSSGDAEPATLTAANARMTARVVGILDRFGNAIVADIADAAERTARLHGFTAEAKGPPPPNEQRARPQTSVIDVEAIEVQPDKTTATS